MRFVSRGCVSVPLVAFVFRRRFSIGVHVVRSSPGFLYRSVRTLFMALSFLLLSCSSFVFPFPAFPSSSFSSSRPFPSRGLRVPFRFMDSTAVPLCFVFPFSDSTSVRSRRFIAARLQAEVDGPTGQGRPRARGGRPRGWRGGVGPGSRTRAAMGVWGRRRRGGRRPVGSAGRRTRRSR